MVTKIEWPVCDECEQNIGPKDTVYAHFLQEHYITKVIHEKCAHNYAIRYSTESRIDRVELVPIYLSEVIRQTYKIIRKLKKGK